MAKSQQGLDERFSAPSERRDHLSSNAIAYATGGVLAISVVLGGGTHSGYLGDVILQLFAVFLIGAALREIVLLRAVRKLRWPLVFLALLTLVPLLQLIPLPRGLWNLLPGRDVISETYRLLNESQPLLPMSMSPSDTWLSALAMLPPMSIFLGCLTLDYKKRRSLSVVVILMAVISVFLGLLQLAQGPNSVLRLYDFTNKTEAVGFFANRNHFAALLYSAMLFTAIWLMDATITVGLKPKRRTLETTAVVIFAACLTAFVALLVAQLMARSRAGLGLSLLALFGALALGARDRRALSTDARTAKIVMASLAVTIVLTLQFALFRILERFAADPLADARIPFARNTAAAAKEFMPFGSGLGTFVPVYQMFEKPSDVFPAYANHAHNDVLEVWLETGVVGLILMGVFFFWVLRRGYWAWRAHPDIANLDVALMRAASIVLLLLALHSLVDYPLRTSAMMAVAAFACALLIPPVRADAAATKASGLGVERSRAPRQEPVFARANAGDEGRPAMGAGATQKLGSSQPRERWGQAIEWPESWRQPTGPTKDPNGTDKK